MFLDVEAVFVRACEHAHSFDGAERSGEAVSSRRKRALEGESLTLVKTELEAEETWGEKGGKQEENEIK